MNREFVEVCYHEGVDILTGRCPDCGANLTVEQMQSVRQEQPDDSSAPNESR